MKNSKNLPKLIVLSVILLFCSIFLRIGGFSYLWQGLSEVRTNIENTIAPKEPIISSKLELDNTQPIGLGVYQPDAESTGFKSVANFEDMVGRKMEYILFFKSWGDAEGGFPVESFKYIESLKLTPIFTWEPWKQDFINADILQPEYSLEGIISGKNDQYIKSWAEGVKQVKSDIIIRFAHEMTTKPGLKLWYPWQGEPDNYIQAFRHVVEIFKESGVKNVKFMWSPIVYDGSGDPKDYYPGDNYVDLIGLTVLDPRNPKFPSPIDVSLNCKTIIDMQFNSVKQMNKPIIIAELLSGETAVPKAKWYRECLSEIKTRKSVIGVISVQIAQWPKSLVDYRVNSSAESLNAFKEEIAKGGYK